MSGELTLTGISISRPGEHTTVVPGDRKNYYQNDSTIETTKAITKLTSAWDFVQAKVKDTGAKQKDLSAKNILAKYTGTAEYKILGSEIEKHFVEVNANDFKKLETKNYDGKEFTDYGFDAEQSDGAITLPSTETDSDGTEYCALGGKTFTIDGKPYTPKIKP